MSTDVTLLRDRINDQQVLLADALPYLRVYFQEKLEELGGAHAHVLDLKDIVNRMAKQVGKPPVTQEK